MKKMTDYVLDREGNAVVGAEVYVRKQSDNTLVDLFSDDGSTATNNPVTTDSDGEFSFWTANQTLKLQVFVDDVQEQEVTHVQHWDFDALVDPGADRLVFWDDSASEHKHLSLDTGLSITDTTLSLDGDIAVIAGLADPNADRILFWDDSAGSYTFLAPSTGITISTTNLTVDAATTAEVRNNTADKVLLTDETWAAAGYVTLNDSGGNIAVDMSTGINFAMTMDGDYTLSNPTNTKDGQQGEIVFTQDGTGTQTLAYGSNWKFAGGSDPVLSTAAGAIDILSYKVINSTFIIAALAKGFA